MKDVHLVWVLWICNHLQTHKVPHCQVRSHEKNRASLVGRVGDMTWAENEIFNTNSDNYIDQRNWKWFCHLVFAGEWNHLPSVHTKFRSPFSSKVQCRFHLWYGTLNLFPDTYLILDLTSLFDSSKRGEEVAPQQLLTYCRGGFPPDAVAASYRCRPQCLVR